MNQLYKNNSDCGALPPLPQPMRKVYDRPHGTQELLYYTAEQMRDYALAARRATSVPAIPGTGREKDAERYRHIRDSANNGYDLRSWSGVGKWHVSTKVREGEGIYLWGEALDKAIDTLIASAAPSHPSEAKAGEDA